VPPCGVASKSRAHRSHQRTLLRQRSSNHTHHLKQALLPAHEVGVRPCNHPNSSCHCAQILETSSGPQRPRASSPRPAAAHTEPRGRPQGARAPWPRTPNLPNDTNATLECPRVSALINYPPESRAGQIASARMTHRVGNASQEHDGTSGSRSLESEHLLLPRTCGSVATSKPLARRRRSQAAALHRPAPRFPTL